MKMKPSCPSPKPSSSTVISTPRVLWNVFIATLPSRSIHFSSILPTLISLMCLWMYSLICSPIGVMAALDDLEPPVPGPGSLYQEILDVNTTMIGVIFLITGVLLLVLGRSIVRIALALVGAYFFSWLGFLLLTFLNNSYQVNITSGIYWGVCLGFAVVGALLSFFVYKLGLLLAGGVLGFVLATWILSLGSQGLIQSDAGRRAFVYIFALVMGILVLVFERFLLNLVLPIIGSYFLFLGIDVFAKTGFSMVFTMVISSYSSTNFYYQPDAKTYAMLAGFVLTALLGVYIHFRRSKK